MDLQNLSKNIKTQDMNELSIDSKENNNTNQRVQFQKLTGYKAMHGKYCKAFEFNTDTTIMFVASGNDRIKVFGFNNNNKLIQTFNNKVQTFCLAWIKKSNSLVSEGEGYSILIWQNYWDKSQKLQGHSRSIFIIIINQAEDLLITGSEDGTIKFWKNIDQIWNYQQTLDVGYSLNSLNMNKLETKLISCDRSQQISVIEYKSNQQWSITQNIKVEDYCNDLLFINENSFVLVTGKIGYLDIFNYSLKNKQYIKEKRIQLKGQRDIYKGFGCQFVQEKNILIAKHYCFVIIFQINQEGEFIIQQVIEQITSITNGKLTKNGQYLILWNSANYLIQVWKLQE